MTFVAACLAVTNARAAPIDWRHPSQEPADAQAALQASDEYAWRIFVAVNWLSISTAPNIDRPATWENWPTRNDVLRRDGADPGRWEELKTGSTPSGRFERISAKDRPNLRHIERGKMVAGADATADMTRLTEIRFNRAAFDYIRAQRLYCPEGQLQLLKTGTPVQFPAAARTIKARWRPIAASERARYHTMELRGSDGRPRLYGLVALHIASKDLPDWFWATFEHEDNPLRPEGEPSLAASHDSFGCRGSMPDCNRAPAGIGLEGTVWSHYRLRGTMTRFVDEAGRPRLLANSDLESGLQASSSCMSCHARAALGIVAGEPRHLPILAAAPDPMERRGFVGTPQARWFNPDPAGKTHFQSLDSVWSLALLHGSTQ